MSFTLLTMLSCKRKGTKLYYKKNVSRHD